MKYVLAVYGEEAHWPSLSEAEREQETEDYWRLDADAIRAGVFLGSEALAPGSETLTVTVRDGEAIVTDGPFAETKEQLGGFYLVECDGPEQAVEWAARIPGARRGHVEVRPVIEFERPAWFVEETQARTA